jgi:hypothetical protein
MLRRGEEGAGIDGSDWCGVGGARNEKCRDEDGKNGIQETDGKVIEKLCRELGEGVSVDTTGLRLPQESAKKGVGQGADTQQPEGEEGRARAEVERGK